MILNIIGLQYLLQVSFRNYLHQIIPLLDNLQHFYQQQIIKDIVFGQIKYKSSNNWAPVFDRDLSFGIKSFHLLCFEAKLFILLI